jgi:itaconate CoA-transferase
LSGLNARLIYCSLSGYGQDGPYRDVKAYDLLIQGEGGIIATTGYPEKPARAGIAIADIASGMYAAIGILLALYQREKTGAGQLIDVSMLDSIVSWLGYFPHHYWHAGEEPQRVGMRHHYVTPYGPYLAADGEYVNLAVASAADWEIFCRRVIEKPELLQDPRFATVEGRRKNRAVLEQEIEATIIEKDHRHWLDQLKKAQLPHGIVRGIAQVLAHPQVIARKLIREAESPVGTVPVVANALKMSASAARYDRIPALGEDTAAILSELGYRDDEIASLRRERVI